MCIRDSPGVVLVSLDILDVLQVGDVLQGCLLYTSRLEAIQDYAKEYQSYGGNARDMDCSTKFIYKTDSIGK